MISACVYTSTCVIELVILEGASNFHTRSGVLYYSVQHCCMEAEKCTFLGPFPLQITWYSATIADSRRQLPTVADATISIIAMV